MNHKTPSPSILLSISLLVLSVSSPNIRLQTDISVLVLSLPIKPTKSFTTNPAPIY